MIKAIIVSALLLSSYSLHAAQRLDMSLPECLSVEGSLKDHYDYRLGASRKVDKIFTINCNGPKFYVLIENIAEFRARTGYTKEHYLDSPAAKARVDDLIQQQVRLMLRVGQ
jgi:hypothetical protein